MCEIANHEWKICQSEKLTEEQFLINFRKTTTQGIGIVTGFDFLEVIDIDTKVFPQYFACLTNFYLTEESPENASYQPVPVYNNNIWLLF